MTNKVPNVTIVIFPESRYCCSPATYLCSFIQNYVACKKKELYSFATCHFRKKRVA